MRHLTYLTALLIAATSGPRIAAEGRLPVDIYNMLRVEYDDNIFTTGEGVEGEKEESFKIIEQLELLLDTEQGNTYFGVRYSPSFVYYEDRSDDSTDLNHQFDLILDQKFSPRSSLQIKDTFRRSEEPELVADDVLIRKSNDFYYNSLNANFQTQVVPEKTTLRLDGRYAVMRYDDNDVSNSSDYDQLTGGMDLVRMLAPETTASGQLRYTNLEYENGLRDSDSVQVGIGYSKAFNPKLQGDLRGGWEYRSADTAVDEDSNAPYIDGSVVYLAGKDTRVTVGGGFAQDKSPVTEFALQRRTRIYGSLSQALSAALTLNLSGTYSLGDFDGDDATSAFDPATDSDGEETVIQVSTRLSYQINVRNWIEATYQYTDLESDVRPESDFDRNRVSLGWKYAL